MWARAAGLSIAISDQYSAKPFTARDVKGAKGEGNWFLVFGRTLIICLQPKSLVSDKAKYQVPVFRILCGK